MTYLGWDPDTWIGFGTEDLEHVPMPACYLCGELHAMRQTDPDGFKEGQVHQTCLYISRVQRRNAPTALRRGRSI